MKTNRMIVTLVVAALVAGAGTRAGAQENSWKGESVLPTKQADDIKFVDNTNGKQAYFAFSGQWPACLQTQHSHCLRDACRFHSSAVRFSLSAS